MSTTTSNESGWLTFKQCCAIIAKKNKLGGTLVTGHRVSFFEEAAEIYRQSSWRYTSEGDLPEERQSVIVITEDGKVSASTYKNKQFARLENSIDGDRCSLYYYPNVMKWQPFPSAD